MISIIIVHYLVKKELFACIDSIIQRNPKTSYEIIVVDNDKEKKIQKDLKKKFPKVIYIPNENRGFGYGNNVGARNAKGEYLFFLNPDTKVYKKSIDLLNNFLKKHNDVGIVAPILYDENNNTYPQGANELTPTAAVFAFSFIHKLFPNNPVAKKYWMSNEWDRKTIREVASVPGAAFMIRRKIFQEIGGFDEKFFMYFEEHDLCRRVKKLGWKIIMIPQSKVFHALGKSSSQVRSISTVFKQSRFYYFKKNFGLFNALITESIMRTDKYIAMLIGILLIGSFPLLYRLKELMIFMGDQGWFYLSARDILTTGAIPLVSIPSSHPWLHQGPLWTYMLAGILWMFHFDPLSGAYLSVFFNLLSIILIFAVGSHLFSRRVGIIAALLFATSPVIISHARMPYHTSPIPFLTLIFLFCLYQWVNGKKVFLPMTVFTLAVLYNFQIATFLFSTVFFLVSSFGLVKKKKWLVESFTKKNMLLTIFAFLLPMTAMLLYDVSHGFPQTLKFLAWIGYRAATTVGFPPIHPEIGMVDYKMMVLFVFEYYKRLIYLPESLIALTIAVFSFGFFYKEIFDRIARKKHSASLYLLGLSVSIGVIGVIATKTISEAYLPMLYPLLILITALFFDKLLILRPRLTPIIMVIIGLIAIMNVVTLLSGNYLVGKGTGLADRTRDANKIVTLSDERSYNLVGTGEGSQFASFTMNYEYLAWWLGNGPSHKPQALQFFISETDKGVTIIQVEKHD